MNPLKKANEDIRSAAGSTDPDLAQTTYSFTVEAAVTTNCPADKLDTLYALACELEGDDGVFKQDLARAAFLYCLCAEQGYVEAINSFGLMQLYGKGVDADLDSAIKLFEVAAATDNIQAMINLGYIYEDGADDWILTEKEPDGRKFQQQNGEVVYESDTPYFDPKRAAKWYKLAMEAGSTEGAYGIARLLYNGKGVKKNYKESLRIFSKLAELGFTAANFYCGAQYQNGFGAKRDYEKARRYYVRGAVEGDCEFCLCSLGALYARGLGVKKDEYAAFDYYSMAAAKDETTAMMNLGWCYEVGQGVEKDIKKAMLYYCSAATKGKSDALLELERLQAETGIEVQSLNEEGSLIALVGPQTEKAPTSNDRGN
jgi:TPR repeat protein